MDQLPSSGNAGIVEKIMRWLPIIGLGIVGFWFWGTIAEFVQQTLKSTLYTVLYGAPLAILAGSIFLYPMAWWMGYKSLCKKITSIFIKIDPLSFMDRYVDVLSEKLDNLNKIKVELKGRFVASDRRIISLQKEMKDHLRLGQAAIEQKQQTIASLEGKRYEGAKKSIELYTPNHERMKKSLEFLDALGENWGMSIIELREEIARKREEFEVLRDQAKALHMAEAFLSGNTPEGQVYQESLKALEASVTQKIAYIEDFEKRSRNIMDGIKVENQAQHDEGLAALEAAARDNNLLMPSSFAVPKFAVKVPIQDITYQEVGKKPNGFNLLD